jgi:hypothetical protein
MAHVHRMAVFALHQPTRHVRSVLERVLRHYTAAYTAMLHACARLTIDQLAVMATYTLSSGQMRQSVRALSRHLLDDPAIARTFAGVAAPLENRLRQSLREHVASTLMSYLALQHTAAQQTPGADAAPSFPARLRPLERSAIYRETLNKLSQLGDNPAREQELLNTLQQTRQAEVVSIPFVGVDARYGCGLYYNAQTRRFYARLDVVGATSRLGRPITVRGDYVDVKTGVIYRSVPADVTRSNSTASSQAPSAPLDTAYGSFGRSKKSVFVPLEMGRYHESALRYTPIAYLPQRGVDPSRPAPATPVAARLVRRCEAKRDGGMRYELHVAFRLPVPTPDLTFARPLLAVHRGIRRLSAAVVTDPEATVVRQTALALGAELQALQVARERTRRERQQRGASTTGDRRQARIAKHHIALLANELVALARQVNAQVVMEDLTSFRMPRRLPHPSPAVRSSHRAQRAMLNRRQFAALQQAIDVRLEVLGLPIARTVSAAYIARDCPQCGARQQALMPEQPDAFLCATCAFHGDRDLVAAANIARKFVWLQLRSQQKRTGLPMEEREPWERFAATHPVRWAD